MPHVASPTGPAARVSGDRIDYTDVKNIPIDPNGFRSHHGRDGAGAAAGGHGAFGARAGHRYCGKDRVGADRVAEGRALHQNNEALNQNGWFVGFTPRRNPDIIVAVLFEGGEHGKLAARLATQVIKAYVDKQRRQPTKVAKLRQSGCRRGLEYAGRG